MGSVRRAVLFSSVTRYSTRFINLFSAMVIARLLTPEEIGTFAIASAVVMMMSEFRLLGAGAYLIRESKLTEDKIRSAVGLTIIISWGLGLLIWLISPAVSSYYDIEAIKVIFRILSVSFFLAPFISIPTSLLMRSMKFRELFYAKLLSSIVNLSSTIVFILMGFSFYSLAMGYTLAVAVELGVIVRYWPREMVVIPGFSNFKSIASFGIFSSLGNFFRRGVVSGPDMVIGKIGTTAQVGMFSRGLGFIEFVSQTLISGVQPVVLPYLSEAKRSGDDTVKAYLKASAMLGGILWPVLAVASVVSLPAILLFFGPQWVEASIYATWIAYWAMFRVVNWFSPDLLVANGLEKVMVIKEGLIFFVHVALIYVCYDSGLEMVSIGFVLAGFIDLVITAALLSFYLNLGVVALVSSWFYNGVIALVCWLVAWLIYDFIVTENGSEILALGGVAAVLPFLWLVLVASAKHPIWVELVKFTKLLFGRR
ncbi:lipopolysaccharide biosynthesis protein [Marinobacter flavimaris]|uniref:Lipopolysaccharide biosynthesis protein n=1 Tax=Marinobacter flavimaris TaxID=262076 RepID=A0A3D8H7T4_9GAMM|nr:oligosaccharide flippase family protein [Marinobacter flavimaris]PPI79363.1 polysaccharide biosynthesis protein [Marinobacter flavimaris]RDU42775.1 lipopolysaccharide biosynthesis protein [Marinobacter flavimaris]